jgi:mannosyltransferase OCH1-like enzyme
MEKIIHQIWIGPYKMPNRDRGFVEETKEKNSQWQHILWQNYNLPILPEKIQRIYNFFEEHEDYAHQADILRLFLIKEYGGIYLDIDFKCINGFNNTNFELYDSLFCYHGGDDYTMPNGILGSSKDSKIMNFIYEQIDEAKGMWFGPSWFGEQVKKYFNLDYETPHSTTKKILEENNINYLLFSELEHNYFKHLALYSWSPENKKNFKSGNINYLK